MSSKLVVINLIAIMKLNKFNLNDKINVEEMRQVKAGSVSTTSTRSDGSSSSSSTKCGWDSDKGGSAHDTGF